jgi:hypothetical protein
MMVPMLMLHPSSVKFPMVSVVNGAGTEADFISVLDVKDLFWMLNDVIKCYTLIFCSYILFTIDNATSCMYCGIHVSAPGLFLRPGVTGTMASLAQASGAAAMEPVS